MRTFFLAISVIVASVAGMVIGLIFNGHLRLQQVIYVDGQLVDMTSVDALKAAFETGRVVWKSRYGQIELPGWYYSWAVPLAFGVVAALIAFVIFGFLVRNSVTGKRDNNNYP